MKLAPSERMGSLVLRFQASGDPRQGGQAGLNQFLAPLERYGEGWMPAVVSGGKRKRTYSREAIRKSLEERADDPFGPAFFVTWELPSASLNVSIGPHPGPERLRVSLVVTPQSFFEEPAHAEERSRSLIELVRAWASLYPAWHGMAHGSADEDLSGYPLFGRPEDTPLEQRFDRVYAIFWLNLLSKELVDSVGRERVLSTPAHLVEELPSGAVLVVTRPTVADHTSEEGRLAQARALVHLRTDLDFDTVLRQLRERSATLAPVEPRFDPDISELLQKVADGTRAGLRQRKYAELNAYRPPEVTEWLPANAAPPSDVTDPKAALERYAYLAEQLVVILHTDVPAVYDETPEALTEIDHWLWLGDYPGWSDRRKVDDILVPSAGAYLGEVLVRRLGGRWVPRRNLEETQVVVGDRAWLPFARARRYLQTRQSVIDYSLTKLFREVERHLHDAQAPGSNRS